MSKDKSISSRLIGAIHQSKGGVSKSTTALTLAPWMDRWGIPWLAYDLDDQHRTFGSRYPEAKALTISPDSAGTDELLKIFRALLTGKHPVIVMDSRAQMSSFLLDGLERCNFFSLAEAKSVRITSLVYPADDDDSLQSLIHGMQRVGREVDYVVVRNPGLFKTRRYDGSPLQRALLDAGAVEITLPPLLETTKRAMAKAEAEAGRHLPFPEALERLHDFAKADLEFFLSNTFAEFDRIASHLLPTADAAKIKPADIVSPHREQPFKNLGLNLE